MGRETIRPGLAVALLFAVACGDGPGGGSDGSASGKGDDIETAGEALCSLEEAEPRELTQFVVQKEVQFRCRGPGGQFVETECCTQAIDEFVFATGCPPSAKFDTGTGSDKQCVETRPDASEDLGVEVVVPTVCCELLCDPAAKWDDAMTMASCRASNGQFHPDVCCMMNDQARCGDATFDAEPDALGYRHCRVRSGELAGQFAPGACCVDECFELVDAGLEVPIDCLAALDDECDGAAVDAHGWCEVGGGFAKASCCSGQDELDPPEADRCYLAELQGEDLASVGCEA